MNTERNCQSCKYYNDGYCENFELKPCYPQKGCDDFENNDSEVLDKIRDEIDRLHYHPKLDFIKNDEVVEMALEVIDKYR